MIQDPARRIPLVIAREINAFGPPKPRSRLGAAGGKDADRKKGGTCHSHARQPSPAKPNKA